jgi:hypothetical protein
VVVKACKPTQDLRFDLPAGKAYLSGMMAKEVGSPGQHHLCAGAAADQADEHGRGTQASPAIGQQVDQFGMVPARPWGRRVERVQYASEGFERFEQRGHTRCASRAGSTCSIMQALTR